jgi:hypothetical protein
VSVGDLCRACGKEGRKEIILFSTSSRWASKNDSLLGDRLRPELLLLLLFGLKKKGWWIFGMPIFHPLHATNLINILNIKFEYFNHACMHVHGKKTNFPDNG